MKVVDVAAGVITDARGRILLARRTEGRDLAGLWEFPGGKREPGETPEAALVRELHEELGIVAQVGAHLITVPQRYPDKRLRLDVRHVSRWTGLPRGREGQALAWVPPHKLASYTMPPADIPVVAALLQPDRYAITPTPAAAVAPAATPTTLAVPAPGNPATLVASAPATPTTLASPPPCRSGYSRDHTRNHTREDEPATAAPPSATAPEATAASWLTGLDATLATGISRLQFRVPGVAPTLYRELATATAERCRRAGAALLLNADIPLAHELGTGLHLRASQLAALTERPPLAEGALLAASCHTAADLEHAARLGCDFVVLGAVKPTATHPGEPGIGWEAFAALRESVSLPVYAIGGLGPEDMDDARRQGAQGVAGIRALWGGRGT